MISHEEAAMSVIVFGPRSTQLSFKQHHQVRNQRYIQSSMGQNAEVLIENDLEYICSKIFFNGHKVKPLNTQSREKTPKIITDAT